MKPVLLCLFFFIYSPVFAAPNEDDNSPEATAMRAEQVKKFEAYQDRLDSRFRAYQKVRGPELKKAGWNEIARCDDGHTWSYILEKQNNQLICEGINARGGPEEHPCVPFIDDLEKFKTKAANAKSYVDEYDKAQKSGKIDQFLKKKIKDKQIPNCW